MIGKETDLRKQKHDWKTKLRKSPKKNKKQRYGKRKRKDKNIRGPNI